MKTIILIIASIFLFSCNDDFTERYKEQRDISKREYIENKVNFNTERLDVVDDFGIGRNQVDVITIDSCEYILLTGRAGYSSYGSIIHKENCKYCEERKLKF